MKQPVKMPALSDTMESGRLLRWLKRPGEAVERGDAVAEIETDKAVMEMEAFSSGTLVGPLAAEDQDYPVGETLAWIGDEAAAQAGPEQAKGKGAQETAAPGEPQTAAEPEPPAAEEPPTVHEDVVNRTTKETQAEPVEPEGAAVDDGAQEPQAEPPEKEPAAAQRASSAVLEQALVGRASPRRREGPDGNAALLKEIEAGPPYRIEPQRPLRKVIASTMSRAVQTPQFRVSTQLDLTAFKAYADVYEGSFTLLLSRACALTVKEQPDFNAAWTPEGLARRKRVDVAIAMEAEHGLLTPVLRDVAGRTVAQLVEDWRAIKQKTREHRMAPEDFHGATFYLSNLGMFPGVVQFDAVVPPGATAILAVAAPGEAGTMLTLTCDHRVVFGADAARFLAALAERLAHPAE
jgi:pyruvate dehydrogenase E2 component (dihydrolipoamide acetyltransferase)